MSLYSLSKFEIQKLYQNDRKFNSVYGRNNLPKNDEAYVSYLHECKSIGTP